VRRDQLQTNEICIASDAARDSVASFVDACQNKEFLVLPDTVYDLLTLSSEFEVLALRTRVFEWIHANERGLLVKTLRFELQ
jgi:hypothetical protein